MQSPQGEDHLAQAERHVREGEERVARQEEIVAHLQAEGHDTSRAEGLLAEFRRTLKDMHEHLERVRNERRLQPAKPS